jgi:hypothetical protein
MKRVVVILAALAVLLFSLPGGVGAALGNPRTAYLAADVTLPADGTFVNGPSIALGTGTWVISGGAFVGGAAVCKLTDGTQSLSAGAVFNSTVTLTGFIVESGAATLSIACSSLNGTSSTMIATYGSTSNFSWVTAYRVP